MTGLPPTQPAGHARQPTSWASTQAPRMRIRVLLIAVVAVIGGGCGDVDGVGATGE